VTANLLRRHRSIIYKLKRDFGKSVTIYRPITSIQNVQTGKILRSFLLVEIRQAPVLPRNTSRKFTYDLDYIQAGNNFTEGAYFDKVLNDVLIDARDLPRFFEPNLDDFLIFEGKRFDIKAVERFEDFATFHLTTAGVENQDKEKWMSLKSGLDFIDSFVQT